MVGGVRRVSDGHRSGRARRVRSRAERRHVRAAPVEPSRVVSRQRRTRMHARPRRWRGWSACCRRTTPRSTRSGSSPARDRIASCSCRAIMTRPCCFPAVGRRVVAALAAPSGRVEIAASGYWVSPDGKIYAEHGHQIGFNAHRFETWPSPFVDARRHDVSSRARGASRPFSRFYNRLEERYPLVDNFAVAGSRSQVRAGGRWCGGRW